MTSFSLSFSDYWRIFSIHGDEIYEWVKETPGAAYPQFVDNGLAEAKMEPMRAIFPCAEAAALFKMRWL